MTRFSELPHEARMTLRSALESLGAEIEGYYGDAVQVAVPCPPEPFWEGVAKLPLKAARDGYFFPLGTDNPPASMRHDGRYPGSKGFWLHWRLVPTA